MSKPNKKRSKLTLTQKKMRSGYIFILPWFVGFCLFYIRSLFMTVQFSFSELSMGVGGYALEPVGFANYIEAFTAHGTFKQVLVSSIGNMLIDVPLITFFALFMAILLNKKFPGRFLVRAIFFLPIIMNSGAIQATMELSQQMMQGGISSTAAEVANTASASGAVMSVDYFMELFMSLGIPTQIMEYVLTAVQRINEIIAASGVQIIIFIAALQAIPGSLYEVAKIEGATGYETFWKVTFPMVMPHIITCVVYSIVDRFAESEIVKLAYDTAFSEFNYGLSSVFSLVSTIITCGILALVVWLIQRKTFYYN